MTETSRRSLYVKEQIDTPWGPHTRYREIGDEWTQQRCNDYADGYEFARRELLANGERVEWCEKHRCTAVNASGECPIAHHITPKPACRIVSRLLVDPPKEEDR